VPEDGSACVALLLVIMREPNAKRGIEEVFLGRVAGPMGSYTGKPFVGPGLCRSRTCLTTLLENLSSAVLDNAAFVVLFSCSI
jgi:hypothetical protein